jgi:hypothetical protein
MADSCYALVLNWNSGGQFCSNILHHHFDDAGFGSTQQAATALINAWDTHSRAAILALLPPACILLSIKARKVSTVGGFEAIKLLTTSNVGTRPAGMSVSAVGGLIIFLPTGNAKQRGKVFLPGLYINDVQNGIVQSAYKTLGDSAAFTMKGTLTLTGGGSPASNPAIYSRRTNTWVAIGAGYLSSTIGTQRRRQRPS